MQQDFSTSQNHNIISFFALLSASVHLILILILTLTSFPARPQIQTPFSSGRIGNGIVPTHYASSSTHGDELGWLLLKKVLLGDGVVW